MCSGGPGVRRCVDRESTAEPAVACGLNFVADAIESVFCCPDRDSNSWVESNSQKDVLETVHWMETRGEDNQPMLRALDVQTMRVVFV